MFINFDADVNAQNKDGDTPLMIATEYGYIGLVKLLLDSGADVNAQNKHGKTPLNIASYDCHSEIVKLLLNSGANINHKNKAGRSSLLSCGVKRSTLEHINWLENYSDDNPTPPSQTWILFVKYLSDFYKEKSTTDSAYFEIVQVFQILLDYGADVNSEDIHGNTTLILASSNGYTEIVKLLLNANADVNKKNKNGDNALMLAHANEFLSIVKLLLDFDAEINFKFGKKIATEILLSAGVNINDINNEFINACAKGSIKTVKLLLDINANINAKDKYGRTALRIAIDEEQIRIITILLVACADIHAKDYNGCSPIMAAKSHGNPEILNLFLGNYDEEDYAKATEWNHKADKSVHLLHDEIPF